LSPEPCSFQGGIGNVLIPRARKQQGKKIRYGRRLPWTVVWNEILFKSFQDGYVRNLDMSVLRQLKKPAAKRMYRFLDKRLYNGLGKLGAAIRWIRNRPDKGCRR